MTKITALAAAAYILASIPAWSAANLNDTLKAPINGAVGTSSWAVVFAPMHPVAIPRSTVQSQGYATHPGPRNRHWAAPHGGPVLQAEHANTPGRT